MTKRFVVTEGQDRNKALIAVEYARTMRALQGLEQSLAEKQWIMATMIFRANSRLWFYYKVTGEFKKLERK